MDGGAVQLAYSAGARTAAVRAPCNALRNKCERISCFFKTTDAGTTSTAILSDDQTIARQAIRDRLQPPDSFVGHRCVICMSELQLLDRDHNTTSNSQLIDYLGANLASGCREGHLNQTGCVHRGWIGVGTTI